MILNHAPSLFRLTVAETYNQLNDDNDMVEYRYNIMCIDSDEWNIIISCFLSWFNDVYVMDWSDEQDSLDSLLNEYGLPDRLITTSRTGECTLHRRMITLDEDTLRMIFKATVDSDLDRTWDMKLEKLSVV